MAEPAAPPPPAAPAPASSREGRAAGRRGLRVALGLVAALALLAALLLALPRTPLGSRLLLNLASGVVPGLQVIDGDGSLLGDFHARQLRYALDAHQTLVLDDVGWRGATLAREGTGWALHIDTLQARQLHIEGEAVDDGKPPTLPRQLVLPLAIEVRRIGIDTVRLPGLPNAADRPVRGVQAGLSLGRGAGATHRLTGLALQWDRLTAQGDATLQAAAPLRLNARMQLASAAGTQASLADTPWQADVTATGPLADLNLQAALRARNQQLDAQARVQPTAQPALRRLDARLQGLDAAALATGLPRTALTGTLTAEVADGGALDVQADLRNAAAGRWDADRLPLRSLQLAARSALNQPDRGELQRLRAELGSAEQPAGRIEAQGHWQRGESAERPWEVAAQGRLLGLLPQQLDARAPAIRLDGPLEGRWQAGSNRFTLTADVTGERLDARGQPSGVPLQVQAQAEGTPADVNLPRLLARAGAASLAGQARVQLLAATPALRLDAKLDAFDPSLWWPALGGPANPWRLDGQVQADLRWPAGTRPAELAARLSAVQGQARLQLASGSRAAGVPLIGEATLRGAGSGAAAAQAEGRFTVGEGTGSSGELALTAALGQQPAGDRGQLTWRLPRLATVSPWLALAAPGQALDGDLQGQASWTGRWPALRLQGRADGSTLRWQGPPPAGTAAGAGPTADAQALTLQWQLGTQPDDPLDLQAGWRTARWQATGLEAMRLTVAGAGRQHRLTLATTVLPPAADAASSPGAEPPGDTTVAAPATGSSRTVVAVNTGRRRLDLRLQAEGGWFSNNTRGTQRLGWQGRLTQAQLNEPPARVGPTRAAGTAASPPWLTVAPAGLRLQRTQGPEGTTLSSQVEATQAGVAGAQVALDALQWQRGAAGDQIDLRARLLPTAMAPWLARVQPDFGWEGDLRVAGQVSVQATPAAFTASAEFNRLDGDLVVRDPDVTRAPQALGLSALRATLAARGGVWRIEHEVAGRTLGSLRGEATVRAAPAALWPGPDAALAGQVQLQIAELGQWGHWLPLGWRVGGQLDGQVRLGGQWGTPRLEGRLTGRRMAVRNLLQGVDWHDAELDLALAGDTARLERLRVLAGAGSLSATGQASLGAKPRLTLQAQAQRFAVLQRVDRRVVASGEASATLDAATTRVDAKLVADEGFIDFSRADAPSLGEDVRVRRPGDPPEAFGAADDAAATRRTTQLDIRADLGPAFRVSGRGLAARLAGNLRLTSPGNKPALNGTIRAVDGTYAAYGQKLRIERGNVTFSGAVDNPALDVRALRDDLDQVQVGVAITGTAQFPRVRLVSEPEMSDADRLSWLLLGRGPDGLARNDMALLQSAAYALLAGENEGPGIVQRLGLDSLSVSQTDGTVRETVVSLGKQLSRRWYVGYERSLQATAGNWQLIYRLAQRFTVRAQSGSENALDFIWSWRWGR